MSEPGADPSVISEDLEDLYENAPFGYLSTAADGTIFKVNATFAGWMGFAAGDADRQDAFATC